MGCMLHRNQKRKTTATTTSGSGWAAKFEACESPEECLLREVKEETGVTLTRWRYRGIITFVLDGVGEYMHLFTADRWQGEPACGDSAEGVLEWVPREKVPELPIWEGDKLFFPPADEERPFFLPQALLPGRHLDRGRPRRGKAAPWLIHPLKRKYKPLPLRLGNGRGLLFMCGCSGIKRDKPGAPLSRRRCRA